MAFMNRRNMSDRPLIVFVHTPKAAGTTVVDALSTFGSGESHVERHRNDPAKLLELAKVSDWISGHVRLTDFQELLADLDRSVKYYAALRDPKSQVRSHYNWLFEIHFRGGDFYENHSKRAKKISEDLRMSDRSKPEVLVENLRRYRQLFMNCQSSFLLGSDFDWKSGNVRRALEQYEFVSTGEDIDELLVNMWPNLTYSKRSNVSRYHFDPGLFDDDLVVDFLHRANARDITVHDAVKAMTFG